MTFLHHDKKKKNNVEFSSADYSVLNYEELLKVNGAGGGGSSPSGPSSAPSPKPSSSSSHSGSSSSSSSSSSNRPSSGGKGSSSSGQSAPSGGNLSDKGYPSSTDGNGGSATYKSSNSKISYDKGIVRVDNTDPHTNDMAVNHPYELATEIKNEYYKQYGESLGISTGSLAAEIKAHADLYNNGFATNHTNVADCGEKDKERGIWKIASGLGYGK